jgi:hypothetical protein
MSAEQAEALKVWVAATVPRSTGWIAELYTLISPRLDGA